MNLRVGDLLDYTTDQELESAVALFDKTNSVRLVTGPYSWQSKAFAFVAISTNAEIEAAITVLSDKDLHW